MNRHDSAGGLRITRRDALRGIGVGAGVVATGSALSAGAERSAAAAPPASDRQLWTFDLSYLYDYDLSDPVQVASAYDQMHLVSALQGIVNRDRPQLYVMFVDQFGSLDGGLDIDGFWLDRIRSPGQFLASYSTEAASSIDELLQIFGNQVHGAVVWDPAVRSTSNVASTVAGVQDILPLRYDTSADSLYQRYADRPGRLPVRVWLINKDGTSKFSGHGRIPETNSPSTGSAKCDAYIWAKDRYMDTGRCAPGQLGFYLDSYWMAGPGPGLQTAVLCNHDYLISHRGFIFDLSPWDDETPVDDPDQPIGTDRKMMQAILLSAYRATGGKMTAVHGFPPWAWKYTNYGQAGGMHEPVATEWQYAQIASSYNAYMDADAVSGDIGAMANASVFQHQPLQAKYRQNPKPTVADLQKRGLVAADGGVVPKRYVMFYVGDYDSAAWIYRVVPGLWADPARGSLPLSWAFNPNLAERIGPAFLYTRDTRSANDFFIAGDSGAGYLNPGILEVDPRPFSGLPAGMKAWAQHCVADFHRWDISVTGFVIDGFAPPMDAAGREVYASFSTDGFAEQQAPVPVGLAGNTPFVRMGTDLGGAPADAAHALEGSLNGDTSAAPLIPEFHSVRTVLQNPTWHSQVTAQLAKDVPDAGVEFVDAYTFYALVRQYLQGNVVVTPVGYALPSGVSAQLPLQLSNFRTDATSGTLSLTLPDGWSAQPATIDFSLDAGQTELVWLDVRAPSGLSLGSIQTVTVVVSYAERSHEVQIPVEIFPAATAKRASGAITIDGQLDSTWQDAVPISVTPDNPVVRQFGMVWDQPPQGGTVRAMWDTDNLYIFAELLDEDPMAPVRDPSQGAPWLDDGVAAYVARDDWSLKVASSIPYQGDPAIVVDFVGTATSVSGSGTITPDATVIGYQQTATGYNLEMAIKWSALVDFAPAAGMTLRFTPLILDRRQVSGAQADIWGQMMWVGSGDDPQRYGFLHLDG